MMSLPDFRYKQTIFYRSNKLAHLRFQADNIIIEADKKIQLQHSCHRTFALFIIGNITVTNILLKKARQFGFPIILMNNNFRIDACFNNRAEGNTLLRMKQYQDTSRRHRIAQALVQQKINNQCGLLKNLRHIATNDKKTIKELELAAPTLAIDRQELMGIEGVCSRQFFAAYFRPLGWQRRAPRCKSDIYNLLLDIGYTGLFNFIEAMLALYGFDLYCGVYHTFFYQRKSLVCDIIEPFRCIVDRRLRKAYNMKQINSNDFYFSKGEYSIKYKNQEKYIRLFMKDIIEEKENIFRFIQQYYRWFLKNKPIEEFPIYKITGE